MTDFRSILRRWREPGSVFLLTASLMIVAALAGGASQMHSLRLALVELVGLALLAACLIQKLYADGPTVHSRHAFAATLSVLVVAIPLVQLVPLPPAVWTNLPGREQLTLALGVVGMEPGWAPISLAPDQTWKAALALIPPLGMVCAVVGLGADRAGRLIWVLGAITAVNIAWGLAQAATAAPVLYLWPSTDAGAVSGLFANRNHFATLCLMILPFAAVRIGYGLRHRKFGLEICCWVVLAAISLLALLIIGSRAGIVLLPPLVLLSVLAAWIAAGRPRISGRLFLISAGVIVVVVGLGVLAAQPTLARFGVAGVDVGRLGGWPIVVDAAQSFLPVGSGVGSFDTVYRSVEPMERLTPLYFNHAHNEYLEIWLETGWLGVVATMAFLVWFARRSWTAWLGQAATARDLQRAASLAILICLLHSVADYPMRTEMILVTFSFACGLLELASQPIKSRSRKRRIRQ